MKQGLKEILARKDRRGFRVLRELLERRAQLALKGLLAFKATPEPQAPKGRKVSKVRLGLPDRKAHRAIQGHRETKASRESRGRKET